MTIYLKYPALFIFFMLLNFGAISQEEADDEEFNISIKLGAMQTTTYFNQLQMDYTDQAEQPNHIVVDFAIGNNPLMYGGELTMGSRLYHKGFYFDGIGFGIYGGHGSSLFQYCTGAGYGVKLKSKWKLIASASSGYGVYNKLLAHKYFSSASPVVVNGKTIYDDFELEIIRHTVFIKPVITLQYQIKGISLNVFGGYQFNVLDKEMTGISERTYYGAAKTIRLSTGSSIKEDGNYISGKMMNFNGIIFGVSAVFNLYY